MWRKLSQKMRALKVPFCTSLAHVHIGLTCPPDSIFDMSIFSWFAAQYRMSYFIFCSFKLKRKNSCPYFTLWVCLLKFKLSIHWERKCDLSGFAFNVAWLLVPERLVWIFQHLWMHNAQPWSRWATAAEDHTRYHCFKLRTANWGYKWHRLTKTRQKTKHKTKLD